MNGLVNFKRDDEGLRELALFAGAGGGILGGHLLGWRTVCAVEYNAYARSVLLARQNDGTLPPFPVWDDVRTFDGKPWRGRIDVVSGGFPCQDISSAGKGAGIEGARSGLWDHMRRIIREVQPRGVVVENSPTLTSRGLGKVLGDLAALGFDAEWGVISAADTGAPHLRERIWIVANASGGRCGDAQGWEMEQQGRAKIIGAGEIDSNSLSSGLSKWQGQEAKRQREAERAISSGISRWPAEPRLDRVANGVADRMDRIKSLGNGQVPRVAAAAWRLLA